MTMPAADVPCAASSVSPLSADAGFCLLIPGFLTEQECREHIAQSDARGFASAGSHYPPSYRNNERQVVDDSVLARRLGERLVVHVPEHLLLDGQRWAFDSLNERFRFCRYGAGQQFNVHRDGVHYRGPDRRSCLTFMVYLTDGDAFGGGDTVFYSAGPGGETGGAPAREIGRVRPCAGSLIVFDHSLWHAGAVVTQGVKHILRSDVLYRREGESRPQGAFEPGHDGYVWTMARLGEDLLASGGRDGLIRLWRLDGASHGTLPGHRQSVLGLAALADGSLASISRDGDLRLWDVRAGACTRVVKAHAGSGLAVLALQDGTLATGGADGSVRHWQADGSLIATHDGHGGWVWSLAESAQGQLVSASEDGSLRVWDLRAGRCIATLPGAAPLRDVVALGPDRLASGDSEGCVMTWARSGGAWIPVRSLRAHRAAVRRLRVIGDGLLASAGEDYRVCVWRLADQSLCAESHHEDFATDVMRIPGGYLSCAYDGRITSHTL